MVKNSFDLSVALKNSTDNSKEPALVVGGFTAFLTAIWTIITVFADVPIELQNAINSLLVIILPWIVAFLIRRKVWSPDSVQKVVKYREAQAINRVTPPGDSR